MPYRESGKPTTENSKPNLNPKFGCLKWYSDTLVFYVRQHPDSETQDTTKYYKSTLEAISALESEGWELLFHNQESNQLFFVNKAPPVYEYGNLDYCGSSNDSSLVGYTFITGRYTQTNLRRFNQREVFGWLSEQGWEPIDSQFRMFKRKKVTEQ
jgi:hypothetical protein